MQQFVILEHDADLSAEGRDLRRRAMPVCVFLAD